MSRGQLSTFLRQLRTWIGARPAAEQADGQLLERFVDQQDEAAFASLVQRHGPMVLNLCQRVLHDPHEAEDAFQATFLVLVRKAGSLDRRSSLGNWLYTVAYHTALRARANAARRRSHETQAMNRLTEEHPDESRWSELRPLLDAELQRLPERYRAPLVLCYLQGRTNEEAAQELGWPSGTVKGRLARARQVLRDRLARRGIVLTPAVLLAVLTEKTQAALLSPLLVDATVKLSVPFLTQAASGSAPTAPAVVLAEGVLHAMLLMKLKKAFLVLLALTLFGVGGGWFVYPTLVGKPMTGDSAAWAVPFDPEVKRPIPWEPWGERLFLGNVLSMELPADRPDYSPVTVGQAPAGAPAEVQDAVKTGKLQLTGARPGAPTAVSLVSFPLNSGQDTGPTLLTREGNRFTLVLDRWVDNGERRRNIPFRRWHLIPLGSLAAGDYELRLVRREMFMDTRLSPSLYEFKSAQAEVVRFTVGDASEPGRLQEEKLAELPLDEAASRPRWQRPAAQPFSPQRAGQATRGELPAQVLRVGTLDLAAWKAANTPERFWVTTPGVRLPKAQDPVYAVVHGPGINSGEELTVREVLWKDKAAVIRVDLWRDDSPRLQNLVYFPLAVVPLQLPKQPDDLSRAVLGEYQVRVEWTLLRAPRLGQPYSVEDRRLPAVGDLWKSLESKSTATFKIE